MKKVRVGVMKSPGAGIPSYGSSGAAGADVRALVEEPVSILSGETALIPTGLFFEIPDGYEIQVRPRSGIALKHGVTVLNAPGTIDSDYRGELKIVLINHGSRPFVVENGMRIAQIVLAPVMQIEFKEVETLGISERGDGGFGHTGHF